MDYAHPSTLLLRVQRSPLFRITVIDHCVLALLSLFTSSLNRDLADYVHVFEHATALADLAVLFLLPSAVCGFLADNSLFSVLKCLQFVLNETCLA